MNKTFGALIAFGMILTGCSSAYYYKPLDGAENTPRGLSGATFFLPSSSKNSIRIQSLGIRKLRSNPSSKVMVFRFYIDPKEADRPWTLFRQDQHLTLPGHADPIFPAETEFKGSFQSFEAGRSQVLDLVFELPQGISSPSDLKTCTLDWEVHVSPESVKKSVRFELDKIDPEKDPSNHGIMPEAQPIYWIR